MRTKNIGFRKITGNFWLVSLNNKLRKLICNDLLSSVNHR